MDVPGFFCSAGSSPDSLRRCVQTNSGTNATARATNYGCGQIYGHGVHGWNYGNMPSGSFELSGVGNVVLYAACPPPPPDEYCTYEWNYELGDWQCMSPIIIATGKDQKYKLTSAEDGVLFDLNGDGIPNQISWTEPGSDVAFLARDINGDGKITSGKLWELHRRRCSKRIRGPRRVAICGERCQAWGHYHR